MKIITIFGTRPEAIKMAPLVKALKREPSFDTKVIATAQHREMLDQVLKQFAIEPDFDLNLMRSGQSLEYITATAIKGIGDILKEEQPDLVLVHGDTTTTFSGALAAFYNKISCGHVEAGLRTGDKYAPYPEEMNRCLTGQLSDYHFAPTVTAKNNLEKNGFDMKDVVITGNTVIDALLETVEHPCDLREYGLENIDWNKKIILLTCHRRENIGKPMENIFSAIKNFAEKNQNVQIVFPIHKNPIVRETAKKYLDKLNNMFIIEPLEYLPFCHLMQKSYFVLTDSGGIQEEAPGLGKPVLVLREVTERPEAVAAGTVKLVGSSEKKVFDSMESLLNDKELYNQMSKAVNPYGDGNASKRIVEAIKLWAKNEKPQDWLVNAEK